MEIKKELVIDVSVSKVYDALTAMSQLSQWFPDIVSLEPKIDGKITFKFSSSSSDVPDIIEGKIIELEKIRNWHTLGPILTFLIFQSQK